MTDGALIMVIDGVAARGENLKAMIEFLDAPRVRIAAPETWRERLGERRLAAVFLGDDLEQAVIEQVIREIGEFDPNTPIVRVSGAGECAGRAQTKRRGIADDGR